MARFRYSLRKEGLYTVDERLNESRRKRPETARNSKPVKGFITRYILNTRTIIDGERLKRVTFGEKEKSKPHKTILLVGETGVGKSTLINTLVNYMLGVKSSDRIWYEIIKTEENQTNSQTSAVIVYDVFTEHSPFSLTVIDTPGFGSTEGIKEDLIVAESLHEVFRSKSGVHEIDAMCLVVTSKTNRLTDQQLYVFNAVLSLFGSDVKKNFVVFITHATRKPYNAIRAIKESKIPCAQTDDGEPVYFRFDNSHCENFNDEEISDDYQASWDLLNRTMESFLTFLTESKTISLKMTEAVLKNRKQLTASILNLKDRITLSEEKQKELEQTKEALQKHEQTKDVGNFEYEVDEPYRVKVPILYHGLEFQSKEATCCTVCEENCHYPGCWWVKNLYWCSVMSKGRCTVCTGKCLFTDHVKEGKIYVTKTRRVKKTKEDLKKKYEIKSGVIKSLKSRLENQIKEEEQEKLRLVEECYQCVVTLEEIALNSISVYTLKHLDFLIKKVKETGRIDRVRKLREIKKRADDLRLANVMRWFMSMHC